MLIWDVATGEPASREPETLCSFGITEAIIGIVAAVGDAFAAAGAATAGALGLGGTTLLGTSTGALIGGALEGATIGGLGGGALSAIEGKPILTGIGEGALGGALTGFATPLVGSALGLGGVASAGLTGAAVGGGLSAIEGGNPLTGALVGGAGGLASGAVGELAPAAPGAAAGAASTGGPGPSAAALAPPASLGTDTPIDIYGAAPGAGAASPTPASGAVTSFTDPSTAALTGATAAPPAGTNLAPIDAAGLQSQISLSQAGGGSNLGVVAPADSTGALPVPPIPPEGGAPTADAAVADTGGVAAQNPADVAAQAAGVFPVPPVPPALDASGNPISGSYPTLDAAQSANAANIVETGGGAFPTQTGAAGVGQSLGIGTPSGTLGHTIDPTLGADPYAPAGAGPGGTFTAAQGATAGPPAASSGSSFSKFADNPTLGNFGNILSSNSSLLLPAALLGFDALKGNQPVPGEQQLTNTANQLSAQSQKLENYLTTGTLPPGVSAALHQAASSAQASIRSQYAARGMSGSSAEAQDLANVQNTIAAQGASIATNLLAQGVSEANLSAQLYSQIMNASIAQDNQLAGALASLASASARPSITLAGATTG